MNSPDRHDWRGPTPIVIAFADQLLQALSRNYYGNPGEGVKVLGQALNIAGERRGWPELSIKIGTGGNRIEEDEEEPKLPEVIEFGRFGYEVAKRLARTPYYEKPVHLTRNQGFIYETLLRVAPNVVSYQTLLSRGWGQEYSASDPSTIYPLRVQVSRLRKKIENLSSGESNHIQVVYNTGYFFQDSGFEPNQQP